MEVLALVAINLGDFNEIWTILGFIGSLLLIPYLIFFFDKRERLSLLLFSIPLVLYSVFISFSRFSFANYNWFTIIISLIGGLSFFFAGASLKKCKSFNIETALLIFFGALAFITTISFIVTFANYGFFYRGLSSSNVIYYDGEMFSLYNLSLWVSQITNANMMNSDFAMMYALVLSSCLPGLLFISPKMYLKRFVLFAIFGGLGLLIILLSPNYYAIAIFILAMLFAIYVRFAKTNKIGRIVLNTIAIITLVVFAIVFLIFVLNSQSSPSFNGVKSFIQNNVVLNFLFNENGFAKAFKPVLDFTSTNYGFQNGGWLGFLFGSTQSYGGTGSFIFDVMTEGGFFALVSIIVFVVLAYISLQRYLRKGKDAMHVKIIIICFLATFFAFALIAYQSFPYMTVNYYVSFATFPITLVALFFIGYTFTAKKDYPEVVFEDESVSSKKQENISGEVTNSNDDANPTNSETSSGVDISILDEIEEENSDEK